MGFLEIKDNTILNIRNIGLKVGDNLIVYCVGGGGGGGTPYNNYYSGFDAGTSNGSAPNDVIGFGSSGGVKESFACCGEIGKLESAVITLEEQEIPVTIGDRGLGGQNSTTNTTLLSGTSGGSTSFGKYLTASGGKGGLWGGNHSYPQAQRANIYSQRGQFGYISPGVFASPPNRFDKKYSGKGVVWLYW